MLSIGDIFSKSIEIYRKNPIIIVPSLIPFVWSIITLIIMEFAGIDVIYEITSMESIGTSIGILVLGMIIVLIITIILGILAEGMTIGMIRDAFKGRKSDLSVAFESTKVKIGTLIVASIIASVIMALGFICLIIPGIILAFLLYFIAQSIMIDDASATGSLGMSYRFFRNNLGDSSVIIIVSMIITLLLSLIPYVGIILTLIAYPFIYSLSTVLYIDRGGARDLQ
jgi:hypothetical protein